MSTTTPQSEPPKIRFDLFETKILGRTGGEPSYFTEFKDILVRKDNFAKDIYGWASDINKYMTELVSEI